MLLCVTFSRQKTAQQFLKDALDVFALRRGVKAKELIPPSSSMDKAINAAYGQLDKTNQGSLTVLNDDRSSLTFCRQVASRTQTLRNS